MACPRVIAHTLAADSGRNEPEGRSQLAFPSLLRPVVMAPALQLGVSPTGRQMDAPRPKACGQLSGFDKHRCLQTQPLPAASGAPTPPPAPVQGPAVP